MDKSELDTLATTDPKLAFHICASFDEKDWPKIRLMPENGSDDMKRYHSFCDKCEIKTHPRLLLVDDELHISTFKNELGSYNRSVNLICTRNSIFEKFSKDIGDARADRTIAHEIGHAQKMPRREFLKRTLGTLTAGASVAAAHSVQGLVARSSNLIDNNTPIAWHAARLPLDIVALVGAQTVLAKIFARTDEFQADETAVELIGKQQMVIALCHGAETAYRAQKGDAYVDALKLEFDKKIAKEFLPTTQLALQKMPDLKQAVFIHQTFMSDSVDLTTKIKNDLYPSPVERLKHITNNDVLSGFGV